MDTVRVFQDPDVCRQLWERFWPKACIFDLWGVRACFMKHYERPPFFLLTEGGGGGSRLLALAWIEEEGYFGHFPGETWQGKTWLEQNKIPGAGRQSLQALMENVVGRLFLRYLDHEFLPDWGSDVSIDETGYLFFPHEYNYSFEDYLQVFSGKTRKKLNHELSILYAQKVAFRYNHMADVDPMLEMNLSAFGEYSYFYDRRFFDAFVDLITFLNQNQLLRMTSVIIGGRLAAVDVGSLWGDTYTVMVGGTHPDFPGVAKLINFHHLKWACERRLAIVDFLCGDFNWKPRFHLQPRPLYKICSPEADAAVGVHIEERRLACAT